MYLLLSMPLEGLGVWYLRFLGCVCVHKISQCGMCRTGWEVLTDNASIVSGGCYVPSLCDGRCIVIDGGL